MKKRITWFLMTLACTAWAQAQTDESGSNAHREYRVTTLRDFRPTEGNQPDRSGTPNDGYEQLLKNTTPHSPQAEAIEKNANYSVDYSTGVPSISIPLYEIKVGNYTLPISINYHASGIKVQDMATPVGLGWTLNAGGVVNKQVRGTDDHLTGNSLDLEYISEAEIDYDMQHNSIMSNYMWHRLASKAGGDTESDRYTYNINGKGGVFRYCVTDNSLRTIPYSGIKIENISTGGYKITDTDGTKYYFQQGETNTDYNSSSLSATTTWYITKIEPATSKNVIEFTYEMGKTYTMEYINQMYNTGKSYDLYYNTTFGWYDLVENMYYSDFFLSYCGYYHGIKLLKQISWAGNTMTFNYQQDRRELDLDLDRLTSVVVKNINNTIVRNITFDNDYYMGTNKNDYRMLLRGLSVQGSSSTGALNYSFNYNSMALPNYVVVGADIRCHEDYWGYYNGKNDQFWMPSSVYSNGNVINNRTPNEFMVAGTLSSITYPTGGSTEIEMEPNVADQYRTWGGLRIKKQTDKDANGDIVTTKTYQYENPHVAQDITSDMYSYDVEYCYGYRENELQWGKGMHTIKPSSPVLSLTGDMGSPIYYGTVTETVDGLGRTVYGFTEHRCSLNNLMDNGHIYDPIRLYSEQYNFDRGNISPTLTSKSVYALENGNYKLKSSEVYDYTEIHKDTFRLGVRFEESNVLINYGGISDYDGTMDSSSFHHDFCYTDVWAMPTFYILSSKSITDYDGKVTTTTIYGYDTLYRTLEPTSETTTVSNGEALTTQYIYPFQKSGTIYTNMVNANIQIPVETKTFRAGIQIGGTQTLYAEYDSLYLPSAYYIGKGSATPEQRIQYDYDTYGNLAYAVKDGTDKAVFLWGYHGLYPVAKIEGMTKTAVYNALGNTVTELLNNPNNYTVYLVNSNSTIASSGLATTFTWTPLVGITSIRKPNLETTYYGYDTFGRLASIMNNNNSVMESYGYNYGGTASTNYVWKQTMRDANGSTYRESYDYYDEQGRKAETVSKGLSPNGSDLVTLTEYDALGRTVKEWLPTTFSNTGNYIPPSTFASSSRTYYNNDSKPFSQTEFEACPSDKVLKQHGPGNVWHTANRAVETVYTADTTASYLNCRIYKASANDKSLTCYGTYPANSLFVVQTKDENNNYSYTFTDKEGRLILERKVMNATCYDTYHVYDIYGNLAFVLPPLASDSLTTNSTWSITNNTALRNYAYNYRYDSRNRCIEKKLPGCGVITMTYDTTDRLIETQDSVQRGAASPISTYYEYDAYGRQTEMGKKSALGVKTPLLLNYYDNYSFVNNISGLALYTSYGADTAFPNNLYPNARGMLTGTRTSSLNSPTSYKYTSFYYGERERLVQCHSQNDLGGYNDEYYTYNFTGTVATKKLIHSATGKATQTELYTNTYDSADRLTNVTHKLNNNSPVTLTVNTYDAVGRLQTKKPMNVETITYSYNVRSWLTGINSAQFSEDIAYNQAENGLAPTNQYYNGNIGAIRWKTGNETNTRGYQFTYNALDWLTNAAYVNNGNSSLHYKTNYWYDKMGNIRALERRGLQDDNSYDYIDDLAFTYNGNLVTRVDDYEEDPTYTGAFNFVDGSSTSNEYQYDGNGNMTKNLNRNISSIQYNLLNLPRQITYQNGNRATYTYDAMGKKLSVVYNVGSSGYTYYYSGNCIYRNGTLEKILVDGGYITLSGTTPTYHYYLQDHLGNNRVVCNASGTIKQVNHYYPFGGLFGESTGGSTQVYKYNGKEFDRINGLDLYDYGARHMSPDICRFTTMDPMAEKYYNLSPYAYCHNNPVMLTDPDGKDDFFDEQGKFIKRTNTGSAVKVMIDGHYKNVTEVDFSNKEGTILNIGRHYLAKSDKSDFNLTVSSTGGDISSDAAFSNTEGTMNYDIYLTNGYVNKTFGDCYDFECVTFHESIHRYDSSTHGGSIGEAIAIMRTANECPAWNNASYNYIQSQASYAAISLNKYIKDNNIPNNVVNNLNMAFNGYAIFELNNKRVSVSNLIQECIVIGTNRQ